MNIQTNIILNTYFIKVKITKRIIARRAVFVFNLEDKAYKTTTIAKVRTQSTKLKTKKNSTGLLNCEQTSVTKGLPTD